MIMLANSDMPTIIFKSTTSYSQRYARKLFCVVNDTTYSMRQNNHLSPTIYLTLSFTDEVEYRKISTATNI